VECLRLWLAIGTKLGLHSISENKSPIRIARNPTRVMPSINNFPIICLFAVIDYKQVQELFCKKPGVMCSIQLYVCMYVWPVHFWHTPLLELGPLVQHKQYCLFNILEPVCARHGGGWKDQKTPWECKGTH
jgi:hypothetical protein